MGASYTRQSTYTDGDVIQSSDTNNEFDQLLAAFSSGTGHTHDGTSAEGGPITKLLGTGITIGDGSTGTDITVTFDGDSNDGVLKWMEDEDYFEFSDDILIASTEKLQFRDTAIYINSSADGQLDLVADTEIQIAATTIDINGAADISGNLAVGGNLTVAGNATVTGTTTFNGGTLTLGDSSSDNVVFGADVDSSIIPDDDDTYDLGSASQQWRNIFIDGTAEIDTLAINGTTVTSTAAELNILAGVTSTAAELNILDGVTSTAAELNILDGVTSTAAELNILDGVTSTADELNILDGVTSTATELNILDGVTSTTAELNILDGVTSTAAELNILDGVTSTAAELNILDGVTSTAAEINIIDGNTSATSTTVADADRVVLNDNGTMVQVAVTDLAAYFDDEITAMPNLVSTGALNSGTITSGFGTIDTGSSAITTTGAITGGSFVIGSADINENDLESIDGITAGTVAASKAAVVDANKDITGFRNVTLTGELDAGSLDISGDADIDGTLETDALSINGTAVTSTAAELNILDGVTSTAAELNILDGVTSTAAELNILDGVTSTAAELNALDGITAVVGELNALDLGSTAVGTAVASKAMVLDSNKDYTGVRNFTLSGELDAGSLDISGDADIDGTLETDALSINGTAITSTAAELNTLDGITAVVGELNALDLGSTAVGTAVASKAVILDSDKDYTGIRNLTLTGDLTIGGDDLTMTTNTAGHILVADGTNFNPISVTDLTEISTAADGDVLLAVDASGGGLKKITRSTIIAGTGSSGDLSNVVEDTSPQLGGNLDMNGADIVTTSNANIDLAPNGTGTVVVRGNNNSGAIVFNCESNSHGQTVIAQPHSEGVTNTMLLPAGANSTLVSLVSTDTLTNKTLTSPKINEDVAVTSTATELNLLDGVTATTAELNILDGVTSTAAELNILDGVTSTAAELNALDGITAVVGELNALDIGSTAVGTAVASKAVILDSDKDYTGIRNFTITGNLSVGGTTTVVNTVTMNAANAVVFEGATADAHETTLTIVDPTADRTINLPNQSGTIPVLAAASNTAITATPAELNILDGVTSTADELNILDGVTATAAEINLIDGGTSRGTTAVADGDGVLINDAGTMRMTTVETLSTYMSGKSVGGSNIVTTGALNSGTITSGFGNIDTGSSTITTTGLISGGSLDIDDVLINGSTIGHTDDTDLITVADGLVTVAGEISVTTLDIGGTNVTSTAAELNILDGVTSTAAELNALDGITAVVGELNALDLGSTAVGTAIASKAMILDSNKDYTGIRNFTLSGELDAGSLDVSGNADIDGTLEADAITVNGTALATVIAGTTVTNATNSAHVLVTDNESTNEENLIAFVENATSSTGNVGLEMDGTLTYNPSSGTVTATIFKGNIDAVDGDFDGTLEADAISINGTTITSTAAELNALDGITAVVGELNALDLGSTAVGNAIASKAVVLDSNKDFTGLRNVTLSGELDAGSLDISGNADIDGTLETDALSINGTTVTSTAAELNILDGVTSTAAELNILDGVTSTAAELNILDGVTSTAAELNILDGVTSTAAELNILDGVTSTAAELNVLDGITAVVGELNALDIGSTAVGTAVASKAVILDSNKDYTGIRNFTTAGLIKPVTYQETYVSKSAASTVTCDLATANHFAVTLDQNTTFAFTNPPSSGTSFSFTLIVTQHSTAVTLTWPNSVDWAGGSAPDAAGNNEVQAYGFITRDGGTTYYGFLGGTAIG